MNTLWQEKFLPLRAPDDGTGSAAASATPSSGSGEGGGAGASSAPATATPAPSTPQQVTPSKVSGETSDDRPAASFDFTGLSLDYEDEIEIPIPADRSTGSVPQVTATSSEPAQPAQAPSEQPPAPTPQVPPASAPQASQEKGAQPPQVPQGQPDSPPATLADTLRGLENPETATALKNWLAQNMYSLSEAERNALDTDAVGAIPGLLSRVHFESAKNAMSLINSLVPQMVQEGVQRILAGQTKANEAMSEFFAAWPGLNQKDHGGLVDQFARMYRSANPKASRQDAIKFVGAAIHAHLGVMPAAPKAPTNGAAKPQPFAPARPGARPPMSTVVEESPWAGLGQTFDDE